MRVAVRTLVRLMPFATALALVLPSGVHAETFRPGLAGEALLEVHDDGVFAADDPAAELNDLFLESEVFLSFAATRWLAFETQWTLETVRDPTGDRAFADQGLFAEQAYVLLDFDPFAARLGKLNPVFGLATDALPGIWGDQFTEDYELAEWIGGEAVLRYDAGPLGEQALTAAVFKADKASPAGRCFPTAVALPVPTAGRAIPGACSPLP